MIPAPSQIIVLFLLIGTSLSRLDAHDRRLLPARGGSTTTEHSF
jgi:hypothetical protein